MDSQTSVKIELEVGKETAVLELEVPDVCSLGSCDELFLAISWD